MLTLTLFPLQSGGEIALSKGADTGELTSLVVRCVRWRQQIAAGCWQVAIYISVCEAAKQQLVLFVQGVVDLSPLWFRTKFLFNYNLHYQELWFSH